MNKLNQNNCQLNNEEGFSILEVIAGILVLVGFILGTFQAMVFSAFVIVKTQEKTEVLNWLEQDLEKVKYQAFILDEGLTGGYDPVICSGSTYGTKLETTLNSISTFPATINISGKDYRIYRVKTPSNNILEIEYTVAYHTTHPRYDSNNPYNLSNPPTNSNTNFVTSLSTQEIPDAAIKCP